MQIKLSCVLSYHKVYNQYLHQVEILKSVDNTIFSKPNSLAPEFCLKQYDQWCELDKKSCYIATLKPQSIIYCIHCWSTDAAK